MKKYKGVTLKDVWVGAKIGDLTVLSVDRPTRKVTCECKCGTIFTTRVDHLTVKKNCGCAKLRGRKRMRLYSIFMGMKSRCYDSKRQNYPYYGGRGIRICDEWLDKEKGFYNFYYWAYSHGYSDTLQIDRIDNSGNYEPSNCRWVTNSENTYNRRHWGPKFVYREVLGSVTQISRVAGVNESTLRKKLKSLGVEQGDSIDNIVDLLPHKSK